jgi:hypothetical protein
LCSSKVTVGDDVAGEELAIALGALAFFDLGHALHRHEHLEDIIPHLLFLNAAEHAVTDLLFKAGTNMDNKPLVAGCGDGCHRRSGEKGVGETENYMPIF